MCQLSRDKLHQSKGDPHKDAGVIADDALRAAMRELPEFAKRAKSRRDDHPIVHNGAKDVKSLYELVLAEMDVAVEL